MMRLLLILLLLGQSAWAQFIVVPTGATNAPGVTNAIWAYTNPSTNAIEWFQGWRTVNTNFGIISGAFLFNGTTITVQDRHIQIEQELFGEV